MDQRERADKIEPTLAAEPIYLDLDLEDTDSRQVVVTSSARGLRDLSGAYDRLPARRGPNFGG
jgi:hypothetical protein